ncbi:MAG TPA: hypothetical protein VGN26_15175 [Armatimonadota bacterium]|jgi:hypothetical protein
MLEPTNARWCLAVAVLSLVVLLARNARGRTDAPLEILYKSLGAAAFMSFGIWGFTAPEDFWFDAGGYLMMATLCLAIASIVTAKTHP